MYYVKLFYCSSTFLKGKIWFHSIFLNSSACDFIIFFNHRYNVYAQIQKNGVSEGYFSFPGVRGMVVSDAYLVISLYKNLFGKSKCTNLKGYHVYSAQKWTNITLSVDEKHVYIPMHVWSAAMIFLGHKRIVSVPVCGFVCIIIYLYYSVFRKWKLPNSIFWLIGVIHMLATSNGITDRILTWGKAAWM